MMPRKLTPKQQAYVVEVTTRRRMALALLEAEFPTNEQLAMELGCCRRIIDRLSAGHLYKFHVENAVRLNEALIELGLGKP